MEKSLMYALETAMSVVVPARNRFRKRVVLSCPTEEEGTRITHWLLKLYKPETGTVNTEVLDLEVPEVGIKFP